MNHHNFLYVDGTGALTWSSFIGDTTQYFHFDMSNFGFNIANHGATSENAQCGLISFKGEQNQIFAQISAHMKSDISNAKKGYMVFRAPNGTGDHAVEILRVGQALNTQVDTDCVGEFVGRMKCGSLKINTEVQDKALISPTTAQVDHVLTATSGGTWDWQAPATNTISTTDTDYIDVTVTNDLLINKTNICIEPIRFGRNLPQLTSTSYTCLIGDRAGGNLTASSKYCLAIGDLAMDSPVGDPMGSRCVALGAYSMYDNKIVGSKVDNFSIGLMAISRIQASGDVQENVAIGSYALGSPGTNPLRFSVTSLCRNVAIGFRSGMESTFSDCVYIGYSMGSTNKSSNHGFDNRLMIGNKDHVLIDGMMQTTADSYFHVHGSAQVFNGNMTIGDISGTQTNVSKLLFETPWADDSLKVVSQILSKGRASEAAADQTFSEIRTSHSVAGGEGEIEFRVWQNDATMNTIMSLNDEGNNAVKLFGILHLANVPTSSAELAPGAVWKDSNGFLKIA